MSAALSAWQSVSTMSRIRLAWVVKVSNTSWANLFLLFNGKEWTKKGCNWRSSRSGPQHCSFSTNIDSTTEWCLQAVLSLRFRSTLHLDKLFSSIQLSSKRCLSSWGSPLSALSLRSFSSEYVLINQIFGQMNHAHFLLLTWTSSQKIHDVRLYKYPAV